MQTLFLVRLVRGERKQRDVSGSLDRLSERSLVLGTGSGGSSGKNLASLCDELSQLGDILVINRIYFIDAELADFPSGPSDPGVGFSEISSALSLAAS